MSNEEIRKAQLIHALEAWKFRTARQFAPEESGNSLIVRSLSEVFGDCGHFGGAFGIIMAYVVGRVVSEVEEKR